MDMQLTSFYCNILFYYFTVTLLLMTLLLCSQSIVKFKMLIELQMTLHVALDAFQ